MYPIVIPPKYKTSYLYFRTLPRGCTIHWANYLVADYHLQNLWCNCYRRRKWTQRHEFKSWTRLIAFHIALIPLGKVWIQLFSLQLWVNSRTDLVRQLVYEKENSEFKPVKPRLQIDLVSYPARAEGLVNRITYKTLSNLTDRIPLSKNNFHLESCKVWTLQDSISTLQQKIRLISLEV